MDASDLSIWYKQDADLFRNTKLPAITGDAFRVFKFRSYNIHGENHQIQDLQSIDIFQKENTWVLYCKDH